ncbi:MAG: tetratricopeptide repeat protein [Candidatus Contendobacter sp.]|nr:tetratricopeptide repeat protein [Candidatus Contendobacter sp.]MDG4559000.1 tetratricopeptide repeat protein [Candidatus Contendobacter sp.]
MGKLINLAVYNPAILDDADFLAGFVARQDLAASLLARLGEITPRGQARHHLILGQRGMGKTSLLRRLALGVREDAALAAVLLPLTFREEQYNVHNLHTFWLNCLDALGDYFEKTGQADKADEIDRDTATLMRGNIDVEGGAALDVFKRWAKREGRRPLLLLDNIDFILDGLEVQHWSLRRIMQEAGGIVVVGASAAYLEATADPKGAFYDFFQVTVLEKLGQDELIACLRRLAQERGEEGRKVLNVLNCDPGRIRALHDLTGGNPRTLILLYLLLELDAEGDVFSDLERLLDQVTVLYKARVEDLAPQARVVLDTVALAWNPITAADIATATVLDTSAVSAQLDRLQKNGVVEKVSLSSTTRAGFQLGERFFNIWYLMRHGPRRQKTRLRWLTSFLRGFYSPSQLTERALELLKGNSRNGLERGHYAMALGEAVDDKGLRHLLAQEARTEFASFAAASGKRLEDIVDLEGLPTPSTAQEWFGMGSWLHGRLGRYNEAEAAYRQAIALDLKFASPWNDLGNLLQEHLFRYEEAEAAYRQAIAIDSKFAWPWYNLGNLMRKLANYGEAETAYRQAIALDSQFASPWNNLGNLLQDYLTRYKEAETCYRQAIKIDWGYILPWINLGCLLHDHLARHEDAENAYLQAINLNASNDTAKACLAFFYYAQPDKYSEAEALFETVEARLPSSKSGLLRAFRALAMDNFGEACSVLEALIKEDKGIEFNPINRDLLRLLRLAAERGYGDKLIAWLDEQGYADHYWPLRVAFDAYLHGEAKLMDVNPEVRGAAKRIYDWLDSARRAQAAKTEESGKAPQPKRKKVTRKTAPPPATAPPAG